MKSITASDMNRIVAIHLLNDYSGSPKVLMQLLKTWTRKNIEAHLFTSGGSIGFLSDLPKVTRHLIWYRFSQNPLIRICNFFISQLFLMIKLLFFLRKEDTIYINTVLPFGAAVAGKLRGCKIIYHVHETSVKPKIFKDFLFGIARLTASKGVFVSDYLMKKEPFVKNQVLLYNVLEHEFAEKADKSYTQTIQEKAEPVILMICSLKSYKGVDEFVKLAEINNTYIFKLVLNASQKEIDAYFKDKTIPDHLKIYPAQKDTHSFYREASIIVNLSRPDQWVETFGLTILEGMRYRLPAIVPPVGGITELVNENKNGFLIDSSNLYELSGKIHYLMCNDEIYRSFSDSAYQKSLLFSEAYFEETCVQLISN
ncbi:glycosyltransferase involved in cell wall biosynthesis [Chryseobacterium sp. SLBN-27]|nr:glycosyltransferase involved in cell wall biosynthesis [Chryseobacterium sp. SLBN-27]